MLELKLETKMLLRISEGVNSFYALTKKANVGSNEGVLSALKRLQKKGLIKKGPIGPRRIQPYQLCEDGFDIVLRFIDGFIDFDSFVQNYRVFFPLVFNYWESLGKYGLHDWVKKVLRDSVPRIDVQIWGELLIGERLRYSHDEFINDLYLRIYGPWISSLQWNELGDILPLERIQDFLKVHPDIMETRIRESENIDKKLGIMRENNELYQKYLVS